MPLFASVVAAVLASSTLGAPLGLGEERSQALYRAYSDALDLGFQAMGPSMKRALATYCQDGQSVDGYCIWVVQGVIIGSHLSGNYEDVLRYGDRYAAARLADLRSRREPLGACLPAYVSTVKPGTTSTLISWSSSVPSLAYLARARLKRPATGSYYQAFYCARRAPNELLDAYDPAQSSVPANEAEAGVARRFEAEILRPMRAASERLQADLKRSIHSDSTALSRNFLQTAVLYGNAYTACSRARFPANLCGYLSADRIEVEFFESKL
ncbi:hypothetical protein FOC84_26390 [Achromobacter pestifer]|uniref:Uncharacterized protein n=1 Tax=Achromobacter pestifer TaxID=1353889 RepID=A0A7D4HWB8_9BURK|nr:hypothetical protein [Achromobacter pestifer]QKH38273.1 hypothetical protein FOC84_26390 [Achromobacter pestifer]